MHKSVPILLWIAGSFIDILSWSSIGAGQRSIHMAAIFMIGAIVTAILGIGGKMSHSERESSSSAAT